jgi:succinate dehydrogenase hydrophobic anchor subunit
MNWKEEVKQFKEQYNGNEDYIHEYVDGLVPIAYTDIMDVALETKAYQYDIVESQVDEPIWKVLQQAIFAVYLQEFSEALLEEKE